MGCNASTEKGVAIPEKDEAISVENTNSTKRLGLRDQIKPTFTPERSTLETVCDILELIVSKDTPIIDPVLIQIRLNTIKQCLSLSSMNPTTQLTTIQQDLLNIVETDEWLHMGLIPKRHIDLVGLETKPKEFFEEKECAFRVKISSVRRQLRKVGSI